MVLTLMKYLVLEKGRLGIFWKVTVLELTSGEFHVFHQFEKILNFISRLY
jgi:hypothetical protein